MGDTLRNLRSADFPRKKMSSKKHSWAKWEVLTTVQASEMCKTSLITWDFCFQSGEMVLSSLEGRLLRNQHFGSSQPKDSGAGKEIQPC